MRFTENQFRRMCLWIRLNFWDHTLNALLAEPFDPSKMPSRLELIGMLLRSGLYLTDDQARELHRGVDAARGNYDFPLHASDGPRVKRIAKSIEEQELLAGIEDDGE